MTKEEMEAKLNHWRNDLEVLIWTDSEAEENPAMYANRLEIHRDDILDGLASSE